MPSYIVDTKEFKIAQKYKDSSYASYAMSDNYGWYPDNRYKMLHDDDCAYDYWYDQIEITGEFYEGAGVSEDMKHAMFKDWLND